MLPNYSDNPRKFYDVLETLTSDQLKMEWQETTEKDYWYMLECVPPKRMNSSCFMVGECSTHGVAGAIYETFIQIGDKFWRRPCELSGWNPVGYMKEIRELVTVTD